MLAFTSASRTSGRFRLIDVTSFVLPCSGPLFRNSYSRSSQPPADVAALPFTPTLVSSSSDQGRPGHTVTDLLAASRRGESGAYDQLLPLVYAELRRIAVRHMRGERSHHTLQPTALVNEAYLRMAGADAEYENRAHFVRAASQAMRRVLVDYARARNAAKRGGGLRVTLDDAIASDEENVVDFLVLDDALTRLADAE